MSSGGIWWKQDWRYRIRIECEHLFMKRSRNPIWIALIIEIWLVKKIRLNSWKIQLNWKVNQINFLLFMTACFPWLTWVSMVEILNPIVLAFHWNFLLLSTAVDWLFLSHHDETLSKTGWCTANPENVDEGRCACTKLNQDAMHRCCTRCGYEIAFIVMTLIEFFARKQWKLCKLHEKAVCFLHGSWSSTYKIEPACNFRF